MKKIVHVFIIIVLILSCDGRIESIDFPTEPVVEINEELTTIAVKVTLPSESVVTHDNLLLASLYSDGAIISKNSSTNIEFLNLDSYEIGMVYNNEEETVLMGYFNPTKNPETEINASTTAVAMVMMQPWTMDLSISAKVEAISKIISMPEYSLLENSIINSLKTDGKPLDNLNVKNNLNEILFKLFENIEISGKGVKDITQTKKPLELKAQGNSVQITNTSSMSYGVKVNEQKSILIKGADKNIFIYTNYEKLFSDGSFGTPKTSSIEISSNPPLNIICDSGLSGEDTTQKSEALQYNLGKISIGIISVLSGGFFKSLTNDACLGALGKWVFDSGFDVFKFTLGPDKSNDLTKTLMGFMSNRIKGLKGVLPKCYDAKLFLNKPFDIFLRTLNKVLVAEKAIQVGINGLDWFKNDSLIEFCIDKENDEFVECAPLKITGDVRFGNVPVGLKEVDKKTVEIQNTTASVIKITDVIIPSQAITYEVSNGVLEPGSLETLTFSYYSESIDEEKLEGDIVIETDLAENPNFNISFSGKTINAFKIEGVTNNNDLVFPNTLINTNSEIKSVKVKNLSDYPIKIYQPNPLTIEGFTYSWNNVEIAKLDETTDQDETTLDFTFHPTNVQPYDTQSPLYITNNTNQELTLDIVGSGIDSALSFVFENGNDFGQVNIGEVLTKKMSITNNSSETIEITDIQNTDVFSFSNTGFFINAGETEEIFITFNPIVNSPDFPNFEQTIEIITANNVYNVQFVLKGEGIEDSGLDLSSEWTPTWDVAQCDISGGYCCGCSFHQNTRNFVFINNNAGCGTTDQCGILDFNTQRIGNSDSVSINEWSLTGETLTIKLVSAQSSGYQFTYRDLNYTGTYNQDTDSFEGEYTSKFTGGLIISAEANGILTLKR